MSNHRRLALGCVLLIVGTSADAATRAARILHHEAVALKPQPASEPGGTRLSFNAFGKRFDLELEVNERVRQGLPPGTSDIEPMRGEIEGIPGSWVRLTRGPDGAWQGMLFDGLEIYAIDTARDISALAVQPLEQQGTSPVIFRLADLLLPGGIGFCATQPDMAAVSGLDAYNAIVSEAQPAMASLEPNRQLEVAVVADYEFFTLFKRSQSETTQTVIARMNVVDGIYSAQLGIKIAVPTITVFSTPNDPFISSDPKELLDEVKEFRRRSGEHMSRGLTHLMTGRDLNDETVGIAYIGGVCAGQFAASLSQGTDATTAALIIAHEMGHNFGAPHDSEPGACVAEPTSFLMAPRLNGSDQFSACSLNQMQAFAASARCLKPYTPPPVANESEPPPGVNNQGGGGGGNVSLSLLALLLGVLTLRLWNFRRLRQPEINGASSATR